MPALVAAAAVVPRSAAELLEHLPWDGDLRHLKGDIASVAQDLGADLDQLFLQACCVVPASYLSLRSRFDPSPDLIRPPMKNVGTNAVSRHGR